MCQFSSMGKTYRPYLPEQDLLLPPSLRDWLPEGHLAYFVSDLIDELNLSAIDSYYEQEERGYPTLRLLIHHRPRRQIVRHHSPVCAGAYHPAQGVKYGSQRVLALLGVLP